ncbi:transposase family protein [Arsenicicoccus dermatophilus]|uniref:transposase family protein n=1 Tax=Arsenicicoccus dermatophilus TaxID=1076331 RepID=UPI003892588F
MTVMADKGYTSIGAGIWTPIRASRRNPTTGWSESKPLSRDERAVNAAHAKNRAPGERGNAQLKTWRVLRRYHGCPTASPPSSPRSGSSSPQVRPTNEKGSRLGFTPAPLARAEPRVLFCQCHSARSPCRRPSRVRIPAG